MTATRQCLQSQLNRGKLEHACEVLVGTRAATVGARAAASAFVVGSYQATTE